MKDITVRQVRERVEALRRSHGDPEAAHLDEDTLHKEVLQAIASGHFLPQQLAMEVLATADIDFPRWCA